MKAIMVMFDSLNRRMLQPYGCDWVHTPNFQRLAQRAVTFGNSYVGSMPCIPARRELHTGRYNFLHRSWGPLEPFDDSMPQILREHGVYTHLITDHNHYFETGGATYHTRYSSWELVRGQEGDPWKASLGTIIPDTLNNRPEHWLRQDFTNRCYQQREEDMCQPQVFALSREFIRANRNHDNWFLQIETFDPHEPWYVAQRFLDLYPHDYDGPLFDWPPYARVTETPEQVRHLRLMNAALHSMCDYYLGTILDLMDDLDLWQDTLLIVNTDHGFLLGEHDWWAKVMQPFYNEVAHTPLFVWDPRAGVQGEWRESLVQTIDWAPTLLEYFGAPLPRDMQGRPLRGVIERDAPVREAGLFGIHGGHVNLTDGRYVYMRGPASADNTPLYDYTLMPTHMREMFRVEELQDIRLAEPFSFTKGCRTMQIAARAWPGQEPLQTLLFDLQTDPGQNHPIQNAEVEARLAAMMAQLMRDNDAPAEQFTRLGLH